MIKYNSTQFEALKSLLLNKAELLSLSPKKSLLDFEQVVKLAEPIIASNSNKHVFLRLISDAVHRLPADGFKELNSILLALRDDNHYSVVTQLLKFSDLEIVSKYITIMEKREADKQDAIRRFMDILLDALKIIIKKL